VIDVNNCLFRSLSSSRVPIVRQVFLLVSTISFFVVQCIFVPFLDPVNNASEWVSRLNYVTTSVVALAVAFDIPGKDVWNTYVLYVYVWSLLFSSLQLNRNLLQCLYYNIWLHILCVWFYHHKLYLNHRRFHNHQHGLRTTCCKTSGLFLHQKLPTYLDVGLTRRIDFSRSIRIIRYILLTHHERYRYILPSVMSFDNRHAL
jgi:hypothetical protein